MSSKIRFILWCAIFGVVWLNPALGEQGHADFRSPDSRYGVRLVDPEEERLKEQGEKCLVVEADGRPVARCSTMGYIEEVFWSPRGDCVAINNQNAISGDYLWVFALPSGKMVKRPFDELAMDGGLIDRELPEFIGAQGYKELIFTKGWNRSGQLIVKRDVFFKNKERYAAMTLCYAVSKSRLLLIRQKVEARES